MNVVKNTPYLLITNGPTGSGKASLVQKTLEHYQIGCTSGRPCMKPKTLLIDDVIEKNPYYKSAIDILILKECKSRSLCRSLRRRLESPDDATYAEFGVLYAKYRGKGSRRNGVVPVRPRMGSWSAPRPVMTSSRCSSTEAFKTGTILCLKLWVRTMSNG